MNVAIHVVAKGGASDVGPNQAELVSEMTYSMWAGGAHHDVRALHDEELRLMLPEPKASWYPDLVSVSISARPDNVASAIDLVADFVLHPTYEGKSFALWREARADSQATADDDVATARCALRSALFGDHYYGDCLVTPKRTRAVTPAQALALHTRVFDASRLTVVVVGEVAEKDVVAALDAAFGSAPRKGKWTPPAAPRPRAGPRLVVVDKPGAKVATILEGAVGPAYGAADEMGTLLAMTALGDGAIGRLTARLREELHVVPWVAIEEASFRTSGIYGWRVRAPTEHVAQVLTEADRVVAGLAGATLTDDEVAALRGRGTLTFASVYETSDTTAGVFSWPAGYGLPDDSLPKRQGRFAATSAADIQGAVARYLGPDRLRVVIVGDWAALEAPLEGLGWGPIELRDAAGAIVHEKPRAKP
jgi:predicted Zn-dependent peptidase